MPPTRLEELHLFLWENLFLELRHIFHILCTSFIKQPKEICPAVWVVLKTKTKKQDWVWELEKLKKGGAGLLPNLFWLAINEHQREAPERGAGPREWKWTQKWDQCVFDFLREKTMSTRRISAKSRASSVRVRHAVMALTSAMRIPWRILNFHLYRTFFISTSRYS